MPPRAESELDQITLHNIAIMNMDEEPSAGFEKLQYLIQQNSFPFETFANLCLLYVKYSFFSLLADVLAENSSLAYKHLNPVRFLHAYTIFLLSTFLIDPFLNTKFEYEFMEAKIIQQTSPEEAFRRFEVMASRNIEMLRRLSKDVI